MSNVKIYAVVWFVLFSSVSLTLGGKNLEAVVKIPVIDEVWQRKEAIADCNMTVGTAAVAVGQPFSITLPAADGDMPKSIDIEAKIIGGGSASKFTLQPKPAADGNSFDLTFKPEHIAGIYAKAKKKFDLTIVDMKLSSNGKWIENVRMGLYNPKQKFQLANCQIKEINGVIVPVIDGHPDMGTIDSYGASFQWGFTDKGRFLGKSVRDFYEAGLRDFTIAVTPGMFWKDDGNYDVEAFYQYLEAFVIRVSALAPEATFSLSWLLYAPNWWLDKYPDELATFDNARQKCDCTPGYRLGASYASQIWRKQMGEITSLSLKRIAKSPIADRLTYIRLGYANCSEWANWQGLGEESFADFSKPMQKAFGKWLKDKYKTVEALQAEWKDEKVTFESNNLIPSRVQRMDNMVQGIARPMPFGIHAADYYLFLPEYTVDTIEYFAKVIRKATQGRTLIGAYYGYYIAPLFTTEYEPFNFQDYGHYAFGKFLRSENIDFAAGPPIYVSGRLGNSPLSWAFSSTKLHKKLMISEDDIRTHIHDESEPTQLMYGVTENVNETIAIAKRDFAHHMAKGARLYYMDFTAGWLLDDKFIAAIKRLKEIEKSGESFDRTSKAEVAVFVSEEAMAMLANTAMQATSPLQTMLALGLDSAGAPWDMFLTSDIDLVNLSQYKLVVIADSYYAPDEEIKLVRKKVCKDGRTVVYLYAPGVFTRAGLDAKRASEFTGINLEVETYARVQRLRSTMSDFKGEIGFGGGFRPLVKVVDKKAKTLALLNEGAYARLTHGDLVGMAEKKFDDHTAIFIGVPSLPTDWLRMLYDRAGVNVYSRSDDMIYIGGPYIGIYSQKGGKKKISLPAKVELIYDLYNKKTIAENVDNFIINMPSKPDTQIIYAGKKIDMTK